MSENPACGFHITAENVSLFGMRSSKREQGAGEETVAQREEVNGRWKKKIYDLYDLVFTCNKGG